MFCVLFWSVHVGFEKINYPNSLLLFEIGVTK